MLLRMLPLRRQPLRLQSLQGLYPNPKLQSPWKILRRIPFLRLQQQSLTMLEGLLLIHPQL